jgi:hypothetical protein
VRIPIRGDLQQIAPESANEPLLPAEFRGKLLLDRKEWLQAGPVSAVAETRPGKSAAWRGLAECSDRLGQSTTIKGSGSRCSAGAAAGRAGTCRSREPRRRFGPWPTRAASWNDCEAAMAFDFFGSGQVDVSPPVNSNPETRVKSVIWGRSMEIFREFLEFSFGQICRSFRKVQW